ncbi:MAG: hypothetical protein K0S32_2514 [Bacteroidetes bacterium]|jgi:hypothetical protein|nr:hypothetical protein [Bacteroidota bacterium]
MKKINTLIISLFTLFAVTEASAQFSGRDGKNLKDCDCNKMLDSLNVTFQVPNSVSAYDIIGFQVSLDGKSIGYVSYYANRLNAGEAYTFNMLSPTTKGQQIFPGTEYGKFKGSDMNIDYAEMCEAGKGTSKLKGQVIGIKMVGTKTEYKYEGNGVITAKTHKLYDGGTNLSTTSEVNVKQHAKVRGKMLGYFGGVGAAIIAGVACYMTTGILNPRHN